MKKFFGLQRLVGHFTVGLRVTSGVDRRAAGVDPHPDRSESSPEFGPGGIRTHKELMSLPHLPYGRMLSIGTGSMVSAGLKPKTLE